MSLSIKLEPKKLPDSKFTLLQEPYEGYITCKLDLLNAISRKNFHLINFATFEMPASFFY